MPCMFCEEPKTIRGHVFSKGWIASLVPPNSRFVLERKAAKELPLERPPDSTWDNFEFDLAVSCTCAECDNGWIDTLDRKVQPLLTRMNVAETVAVQITDQTEIAGWVAKSAAMLSCLQRDMPACFSTSDLVRMREQQLPPERASVWMAGAKNIPNDAVGTFQYAHLAPLMVIIGGTYGPIGQGKIMAPGRNDDHVYLVTFRIQHLAFQIFVPNEAPDLFPPRAAGFDRLLMQLWPINLRAVSWPPSVALDGADGFRALAESFGGPTETRTGYIPL
jgi:hypothetical protein